MDAFHNGAVMRWLAIIGLMAMLMISLAPIRANSYQESPLPTEWVPSPNQCGGMIPNMIPAECHNTYRDYYIFLPTIIRIQEHTPER